MKRRIKLRRVSRRDGVKVMHNFFLDAFDAATGVFLERRVEIHNLTTTAGLGIITAFLAAEAVTGLLHFALGDGAGAAPVAGSTTLSVERYRDVFTQTTRTGAQLVIKVYVGGSEGNGFTFNKAGLFGNGSTLATDSGTLFFGTGFANQTKTSAEGWTFTWTITLADDGV